MNQGHRGDHEIHRIGCDIEPSQYAAQPSKLLGAAFVIGKHRHIPPQIGDGSKNPRRVIQQVSPGAKLPNTIDGIHNLPEYCMKRWASPAGLRM